MDLAGCAWTECLLWQLTIIGDNDDVDNNCVANVAGSGLRRTKYLPPMYNAFIDMLLVTNPIILILIIIIFY